MANATTVRRSASLSSVSNRPASAAPAANANADTWATIMALQTTLNGLISQVAAPASTPEKSRSQAQNETQRKLLDALRAHLQPHPTIEGGPEGYWLTDIASLAGVEKGIAHTQCRKLNYRNKLGMSLEKDERIGKSAFWLTLR